MLYVPSWWVQEGDPFIVWTVHHRRGWAHDGPSGAWL